MYCVRWKLNTDYLINIDKGDGEVEDWNCWWKPSLKEAKLFLSNEEAIKFITSKDGEIAWGEKYIEMEYIHPLNIR